MKTGFFLVIFELCVNMCLSNEKSGSTVRETQESFIPNLLLSNYTDEQYPHNTASDPSREKSKAAFSMHNFTEMNTNFGFNLYRKIAMKHDKNIFFSPLSLSFVLSIFLLASKGETHNQIVQSLNLHLLNGKENQLPALCQQLRNNVTKNQEFTLLQNSFSFIQKDFQIKEAFHNLSKQYFDMEYLTVDFHNSTLATNTVNEHIKQKTGGRIPSLFDTLDQQAKIILVNYFLFRGKWQQLFSMKFTEVETFYIDNYRSVQVPMMFKTERVASTFDKNLQCVVLKLPYKGSVHMLIVMPEGEADFMDLEDHLTIELVDSWLKNMETSKKDIYFPKFKLDQSYHVEELLQDMGIKDLFTYKADLSHLSDQKFMKISQVLQRAVIDVDERGTEAAAASGSESLAHSLPPTVRVNRPFLFMIYEEILNTLLFMGRVINPTEL